MGVLRIKTCVVIASKKSKGLQATHRMCLPGQGRVGEGGGERQLSNIELKQVSNLFVALPMC